MRERGNKGARGRAGQGGAPGAAGPAGQSSRITTDNPTVTPHPRDTAQVWPPSTEAFPLGTRQTVEIVATCEILTPKGTRELGSKVFVETDLLGLTTIRNVQQSQSPFTSGTFAGTTTLTFAIGTISGVQKLLISGGGPASAASCVWRVTGAVLRQASI